MRRSKFYSLHLFSVCFIFCALFSFCFIQLLAEQSDGIKMPGRQFAFIWIHVNYQYLYIVNIREKTVTMVKRIVVGVKHCQYTFLLRHATVSWNHSSILNWACHLNCYFSFHVLLFFSTLLCVFCFQSNFDLANLKTF